MAYALIKHGISVGGANGATTGSLDTTGADILIVIVGWYVPATQPTVSDSKSNSWTTLTKGGNTYGGSFIAYAKNATVGSGHTFTVSGTGSFSSIAAIAFSGSDLSSPLDQQSAANGDQPGSVTPGSDNELIIDGQAGFESSFSNPSSGQTLLDSIAVGGGTNVSNASAYEIQTTATARNPTWTDGGGASNCGTTIATFKAAAGATIITGAQKAWVWAAAAPNLAFAYTGAQKAWNWTANTSLVKLTYTAAQKAWVWVENAATVPFTLVAAGKAWLWSPHASGFSTIITGVQKAWRWSGFSGSASAVFIGGNFPSGAARVIRASLVRVGFLKRMY
jgi:hypothetical protein